MGAKQNRAFIWTCLFFAAFGAIDASAPLDDAMRAVRNHLREQPASGKFVLVLPDDPSQLGASEWTWSRMKLAGLVADVRRAGAQRVAISRLIVEKPEHDDRLAAELAAMPQRSLVGMIFDVNPETGERRATLPSPDLLNVADVALANQYYDPFGRVHETPFRVEANGKQYRGLAAQLAGRDGATGRMARIDYAIDLQSVPVATLKAILSQKTGGALKGRTVLIASADERMNAEWRGRAPSAYAHVIGAETLLHGSPVDLGWVPAFLVALVFAAIVWIGRRRVAIVAAGCATISFLLLPLFLERALIFPQTITGLLLVLTIAAIKVYRNFRQAGARENALSGLPNLVALRDRTLRPGQAVIVAKMLNYAELVSVVTNHEKSLAQMIGARLSAGGDQTLFHGDGGVFAWISPAGSLESIGDHLDALHAFFLKPITVGSWQVDVSVSFGVDIAANDDVATCFARASVAADEATSRGMRWAFYDSSRLDQAEWNVSLLGKLDSAIESGEVWVAYQPKIDLIDARVNGFEALVRWTHPDRGPISPERFVSVAESHGRIDRLTYFVLDDALAMIAALAPNDSDLGVAVNISARMFGRSDFLPKVRSALKRHGIAPSRLTMEITESAAAESEHDLLSCVAGMIRMGVQVSIDDYGTGYSTLEYLKKLKAHELKIDRGFIAGMAHNRSDFLLVKATIDLAHNLGHRVVAEGVETAESLEMLSKLGCDAAQGFLIAKPMPKQELSKFLETTLSRRAA